VNFLIDAHLPYALCQVLQKRGFDAVHTRDLPDRNTTSDSAINEISIRQQRVVVSKDSDFYYSHLLHGRPFKLVLVRTGNIGKNELVKLFEEKLDAILSLLEDGTLVELDRTSAQAHL
jgi:predicted nuclease of predicted toxin-antitoxin system